MQELEEWKEQACHLWHVAMDYLGEVPPEQLYAAAAIAILTTLLLLSLRLFRRSKSNTIVLTGLSGSGKTVLFYQVSLLEENIKRRTDLPHLLVHLCERRPEKLDYIGVSFGLTSELFRFWKETRPG